MIGKLIKKLIDKYHHRKLEEGIFRHKVHEILCKLELNEIDVDTARRDLRKLGINTIVVSYNEQLYFVEFKKEIKLTRRCINTKIIWKGTAKKALIHALQYRILKV